MLLFKLRQLCCAPDGAPDGGTDGGAEANTGAGELSLGSILNTTTDGAGDNSQTQDQGEPAGDPGGNEGTSSAPAWVSQLPKEMRANDTWGQFEKIADLANAYQELADKANKGLSLPDNAKPEEVQAFYEKIGKPKTVEGYKFEVAGADEKDLQRFKEMAFSANLTDAQAKAVYDSFNENVQSQIAQVQQNIVQLQKETDSKLHEEFGNKYPEKLNMIQRGMKNFITPELQKSLANANLLFNSDFVHLLLKLGEATSEAGTISQGPGGTGYKSNAQGGRFKFKDLDY